MGTDVVTIDNGSVAIEVAAGFGPRIVGFTPAGGENLFATVPELALDLPDGRRYRLQGGHRLWLAPEVPEITYEPDDDPVAISSDHHSIAATGTAGDVEKTISIALGTDPTTATVTHVAVNRGPSPIDIALWALTQLRTGGIALVPLGDAKADSHGLQASTQVVGWRYTDWGALETGPAGVICKPCERTTPSKIGTALTRGWLAYLLDGWLFAKYSNHEPSSIDFGATGQVYADADFVELETLGASITLEPGEAAEHTEMWQVWPAPTSVEGAVELVEAAKP